MLIGGCLHQRGHHPQMLEISKRRRELTWWLLCSQLHLGPVFLWRRTMGELSRGERLQIMLTAEELTALDDWRFQAQMPSRAAAIRELLKRGLAAEGFDTANRSTKSRDFG